MSSRLARRLRTLGKTFWGNNPFPVLRPQASTDEGAAVNPVVPNSPEEISMALLEADGLAQVLRSFPEMEVVVCLRNHQFG